MENGQAMDFIFWLKFIELPVIAVLFGLIWHHQRECTAARKSVQEQITNIRVEVAKDYVNHTSMKEIGDRLEKQLSELAKQLETNKVGWQSQFDTLRKSLEGWMHKCAPDPRKE